MDHRDWLKLAYVCAQSSPDPSTQNGAVLVFAGSIVATACNTFPHGVKRHEERFERPLKYSVIEHAERNAIYAAARTGRMTSGATMYCPWVPCADCARAIIQADVRTVVRHKEAIDRGGAHWSESMAIADAMLSESGVEVIDVSGKLTTNIEVLHFGELWSP